MDNKDKKIPEGSNVEDSSQTPTQEGHIRSSTPSNNPDLLIPKSGSHSHLLLILSAVLAATALILIGGFFVLNWYIRSQELKPKTQAPKANSQKPTPSPDPTANWKTYDYPQYTFKYPANIQAEIPKNADFVIVLHINGTDEYIQIDNDSAGPSSTIDSELAKNIHEQHTTKTIFEGFPALTRTLGEKSTIAPYKQLYVFLEENSGTVKFLRIGCLQDI